MTSISAAAVAGRRHPTQQGARGEERELHQPAGASPGRCDAAVRPEQRRQRQEAHVRDRPGEAPLGNGEHVLQVRILIKVLLLLEISRVLTSWKKKN